MIPRVILLTLFTALGALAQANSGSVVRPNNYPYNDPATHLFYPSATKHYICYSNPVGPSNGQNPTGIYHTWSVAATTLTNIVVLTNVGTVTWPSAYGLIVGNQIKVSGSATSALNGTYKILTTPSPTTATITTAAVGDATYTDMTVTTTAPPEIDPLWSIELIQIDASGNTISTGWGWNPNNQGGAGGYNQICANRAQDTGATAIFYK